VDRVQQPGQQIGHGQHSGHGHSFTGSPPSSRYSSFVWGAPLRSTRKLAASLLRYAGTPRLLSLGSLVGEVVHLLAEGVEDVGPKPVVGPVARAFAFDDAGVTENL
jgi:hypothetical protein